MIARRLARRPAAYVGGAAVATVMAAGLRGPAGAAGVALGIVASAFGLFALWRVVRLLGDSCGDRKTPPTETLVAVSALLLKFPVLFGGFATARAMGEAAATCFIGGLGLVYCALIVWALAAS